MKFYIGYENGRLESLDPAAGEQLLTDMEIAYPYVGRYPLSMTSSNYRSISRYLVVEHDPAPAAADSKADAKPISRKAKNET